MVTFFYFLLTLLLKQSNRQGGARTVDLPVKSFDLSGLGVVLQLHCIINVMITRGC